MISSFRSQCVPQYRLLTPDQIDELHRATLELLETIGVRINHPEALRMLADNGCRVDDNGQAFIPNHLVEASLRSAPSRFTVYDRNGRAAMNLGGRHVHFGMGTDLIYTYDVDSGELRRSVLQDVVNNARTADHLDDIDFIASYALPHDVPTNSMYLESFRAQVEHSTKPIFFTAAAHEDLAVIIEMAAAVAGGEDRLREKPFLIHYSEPTSPLTHSLGAVQKLFLCADKGVPINYTPALLSGASGPVTLAGAITVANAEALSGLVMHQLRAKGAPIISGFAATTMDMATSVVTYTTPEFRLTHSACSDLYHHYGVPMWGTAGVSDAMSLDQQAGVDAGITLFAAALDGANLVHDIGYLGQGLIGSPASLVMSAECISYVKRFMRGFTIDREHIALDVIRRVGSGGNYIAEDHTAAHHRAEHWVGNLFNRDEPETWTQKGRPQYADKALEKAREIIATHRAEPLPQTVGRQLAAISERAARELAGVSFTA